MSMLELIGNDTDTPFLGLFGVNHSGHNFDVSIIGRFGFRAEPSLIFPYLRQFEFRLKALLSQCITADSEVQEWIRSIWTFVMETPISSFGPSEGKDLSFVVYAKGADFEGISASGITGIWGAMDGQSAPPKKLWETENKTFYLEGKMVGEWSPLVKPNHPMLSSTGIPQKWPGVFQLYRSSQVFIACPSPHRVSSLNERTLSIRMSGIYAQ